MLNGVNKEKGNETMVAKWTEDKVALVKAHLNNGLPVADVAKKVDSTVDAVDHVIRKHGLRSAVSKKEKLVPEEQVTKKIAKTEVDALAAALGERLVKAFQTVKLEEPKVVKIEGKIEEISILDVSDVHVGMINTIADRESGKNVVTYNYAIFLKELEHLQEAIFSIHGILSKSYSLKKLVIFVLGDIITNDRIFPEQAFEIEKCVGLQIWDAIPAFAQFFNNLLKIYETIEVVCITGHHGRSNPHQYNEPVQNNLEYYIYKCWETQFKDSKRIKIVVPETRRFVYKVGKWSHLIEHGDLMKSFTPTAIETQLKNLYLNVGQFDVQHFGHIHKLQDMEISDKVLIKQNGCWIDKDSYGFDKFKSYSVPKQHFFGCSETRKETWAYKIDLRK